MKKIVNFSESDMYKNAKVVLRNRYKASDGWKINGPDDRRKKGYRPDFTIEKKKFKWFSNNVIQKVIVEVKNEKIVTESHIKQLNDYVKKHSGKDVEIVNKIIIIPSGTNTVNIPSDIDIIKLKKFKKD